MSREFTASGAATALLVMAGCAAAAGPELGLTGEGRLTPCGSAPNCVSSDATGDLHGIEPLTVGADPQAEWKELLAYLESQPSYKIVVREPGYLRAEARTRIFRFVDDVEFHLRPGEGQIAMRSASRLGHSDLGKNRRRLEAVRQALRRPSPSTPSS